MIISQWENVIFGRVIRRIVPNHSQTNRFFMRYLILLLKIVVFTLLLLIRLGELKVAHLYAWSKYRESFDYYVNVIASIALFLLLLDFVQFGATWWYRRKYKISRDDNFIVGVGQIYLLLLVIGMIVGLLSLFRIDVRQLFTSLSIIFAGIAILTKDYISNMINGMIITFSGQLSIGDNVRIGQHRGKIIDITLQNIHLLNDDDDVIYFPNALLLVSEVINYTKREIKRNSIDFEIDLKHLKNVEELEEILIETLKPFQDHIKPESLYLRVAEIRKDSVLMKFQYILKVPNKDLERQIRRITTRRIVEVVREK